MYRTKTCGELRLENKGQTVTLSGWTQRTRKLGGMIFVDLRDRYGITQLVFNREENDELFDKAEKLGREWVIQVKGIVSERSSKNKNIVTGDIEITVSELNILNISETPPFTIETETDGGDDIRMKYRYLDLRRNIIRSNLELRHKITSATRSYLNKLDFIDVETPALVASTPEGARDFVVPSRMNPGQFYALPQSPQLFKQLLMVAGFDRYFQIVKCFRDEDLRADRQPEFTQIDCEMSFIDQEDVINIFEGLTKYLFKTIKGIEPTTFIRLPYGEAMRLYGSDKPDTRFGMKIAEIKDLTIGRNFAPFDNAQYVGAIVAKGCAGYTRKQLDELTEFVKRPQIGAQGLIYLKIEPTGNIKSSVDKFYTADQLKSWAERANAKPGDLMLILCGKTERTQKQLCELRLELGSQLGLRSKNEFSCLWVTDFPLLEYDDQLGRYFAKHHPFTSPKAEDIPLLDTNPEAVR
ncbi:MAG: aspartate--tRNA ligase, partial [Dysgonamonadaceae bacterium]|nr:aspartate--tRNA ligase [Dysgonamonadaceae bacterium]